MASSEVDLSQVDLRPDNGQSNNNEVKIRHGNGSKRKERVTSMVSDSGVKVSIAMDDKHMDSLKSQSAPLQNSVDGARVSRLCDDGKILTNYFEGCNTVHDLFRRGVAEAGDKDFLGWKPTPDEPFKWMSYNQVHARAKAFADGLIKAGITGGNNTHIGIYSQNRPEYIIADQGFLFHAMCPVPLYDTLGVEACDFTVNQAELGCIVCDTNARVKGLLDRIKDLLVIKMFVVFEKPNEENLQRCKDANIQIYQLDEIEKLGKDNPIPSSPPTPDDLCMVCYTSGTTGTPKGVMLTHRNMVSTVSAAYKVLESSGIQINTDDVLISYLPLAHSYERALESVMMTAGGKIGFFQGDIRKLMDDIKELQPTLFPSVPRLLNRVYDKVLAGVNSGGKLKQFLFNMALNSKRKDLKKGIIRNNTIWDKLVFKKPQQALGGRVRLITTGSAPISSEVLSFLRCIVGCPVLEGYGQTENCGIATVTIVGDSEPGHVGPPLPCSIVKLQDVPEMDYYSNNNKGEVCLKGGNVFKGYLKDPEKTAEALDDQGWLHTGDIGEWMPSGTLKIIDRKKNIFKLAQGEYIAPEKIENVLAQSPWLEQVYVHGESLQASIVAIVVPDEATLPGLVAKLGIKGSFKELCKNDEVKKAIQADLTALAKKNALSSLEQVKDIYLHDEVFSVDNGLLTPTFKLRRNDARKKFAPQVAEMYEKMSAKSS